MVSLEELLQLLVQRGGSDLHIAAGSPPRIRVDGKLMPTEFDTLTKEESQKLPAFRYGFFRDRAASGHTCRRGFVIRVEALGFRDVTVAEGVPQVIDDASVVDGHGSH